MLHLSHATRDPDAYAVAQELERALARAGVDVRTTRHDGPFPHPECRALVLLLTPTWWADDAVQAPAHADHLRRERHAVGGEEAVPLVPVLVSGAWEDVAPDELRRAGFFDLRPGGPPGERAELLEVLRALADGPAAPASPPTAAGPPQGAQRRGH